MKRRSGKQGKRCSCRARYGRSALPAMIGPSLGATNAVVNAPNPHLAPTLVLSEEAPYFATGPYDVKATSREGGRRRPLFGVFGRL